MNRRIRKLFNPLLAATLLLATAQEGRAQRIDDSTGKTVNISAAVASANTDRKIDSVHRNHSVRKAWTRSAMVPGWGQIYNRKYWKVPLAWAAVGVPVGIFVYNLTWYRRTRFAYTALVTNNAADKARVHPKLQGYIQFNNAGALQFLRNEFRKDVDYSFLFIILGWGLQTVDAAVDAHLKTFDVSPNLSLDLKLKPGYSELAGTNGMSLVLAIK
ncbi:DUF5683 domain-containing protein [Flaviaesturariibacter amylovorans]|uniref:DUF5683 domain-containing protein n=1 Tax=Flaviaesturariibacter amylovorans TaxID=1084520 RepID=A0ABP8H2D8_9BACT